MDNNYLSFKKITELSVKMAEGLTWDASLQCDVFKHQNRNLSMALYNKNKQENAEIIREFLAGIRANEKDFKPKISSYDGANICITYSLEDEEYSLGFSSHANSSIITSLNIIKGKESILYISTKQKSQDVQVIRYAQFSHLNSQLSLSECDVRFLLPYENGYLYFCNSGCLDNYITVTYIDKSDEFELLLADTIKRTNHIPDHSTLDFSDINIGDLVEIMLSNNLEKLYSKIDSKKAK